MENKGIRPLINVLNVGEMATYPLSRVNSVRVICSMLSLETGKVFRTKINKDEKVIKVKRIS